MFGVLITNGGAHPADKWAAATASHIVSVADNVGGGQKAAAVKLEAAIIDILEKHHNLAQKGERFAIQADASRVAETLSAQDHTDLMTAADEIITEIKATPWAAVADTEEFKLGVVAVLRSHIQTNMQIERQIYADSNPNCPHAKAFREMTNVGGN